MDLGKLREQAMHQSMKLMQDPRFMKLMSHPRAQKLMMVAFQIPGRIESVFAAQGKAIAKRFKLATREEVDNLKSTIRDLERTLRDLKPKS